MADASLLLLDCCVSQLSVGSPADGAYVSGSGSASLTFQYTVRVNDYSVDLSAGGLSGSISSVYSGNAALTMLPAVGSAGSLDRTSDVVVDGVAPVVVRVTSVQGDGSYKIGDVLDLLVEFSEALSVQDSGASGAYLELAVASVCAVCEAMEGCRVM